MNGSEVFHTRVLLFDKQNVLFYGPPVFSYPSKARPSLLSKFIVS